MIVPSMKTVYTKDVFQKLDFDARCAIIEELLPDDYYGGQVIIDDSFPIGFIPGIGEPLPPTTPEIEKKEAEKFEQLVFDLTEKLFENRSEIEVDLSESHFLGYTVYQAELLRSNLENHNSNPIDLELNVIPPFKGASEIKLIIIGQDPTIRNVKSRKNITCTLNLDKNNSLKTYIGSICEKLGITVENVYATNLFKYFYTYPPADTPEVLQAHLEPNLRLLMQELNEYKSLPVITLGQPLLQLLCGDNALVKDFWDYEKKTRKTNSNFRFSNASENKLNRDFYPFPHQPSIRKEFYKNTLNSYTQFMSSKI